jgi:hypothetical protein
VRWLLLLLIGGCGTSQFERRRPPPGGYDAAIVPGCPSEDDGSLTRCQMARALFAAKLWDEGGARHFIVSGAAVHSPYVEAEALAAAMAAAGVPPERIYLEPNALHTDENMFYSLQIARALGFRTLAVVGDGAAWDCRMLLDWGQRDCGAFAIDRDWVRARHRQLGARLDGVRTRHVDGWIPLLERERRIAASTGRHRPPSYMLYLSLGLMRLNGERWVPPGTPARAPTITWASRAR